MENYFMYYKGYTPKEVKTKGYILSFIFAFLFILTFIVGLLAICIAKIKGMAYYQIFSKAPVVVIMTYASVPLAAILLFYAMNNYNQVKENSTYRRITVFIEEEAMDIRYKIVDSILYLKTHKVSKIPLDQIEVLEETHIKLIFKEEDKEYFIEITHEAYLEAGLNKMLGGDINE